ncbi:unnamed protein product [Cuscuta epithymum]|uniref:Uncharacterized protein n=1 Tax=Cuscuta epithymum TaxID=186058 RepID=A0AAV0C9Y4_9ASTE|nr:unnamed protein product [Cuscuta epithymum]CAH9140814.1 unnamed protein product [Cuscuta epithymum]
MGHFVVFLILAISCTCYLEPKLFNVQAAENGYTTTWNSADGTWYGSPTGYGSDGGSCGYTNTVGEAPLNSLISSGSTSLYKDGKGCGTCYKVKCSVNEYCSGESITVVITDSGVSETNRPHFDLSGTSFGALAKSGQAEALRNAGTIELEYQRTTCDYKGTPLTFTVDTGANDEYFATLIEYVGGSGELSAVYMKESASEEWLLMDHSWGALWKRSSSTHLVAPFWFKLVDDANKTLVAENVIPTGWAPGVSYKSAVSTFT